MAIAALEGGARGRETGKTTDRAVVIFVGCTRIWWLRWLRRGYRHCLVAVETDGGWVLYDPLCHYTEINVIGNGSAEGIIDRYRTAGCTAVLAKRRVPPRRLAPVRPYTCVEAVKRILGLREPLIFTPYQLYRWLRRQS
jgi:hypothetical protein